MVICLEEKCMCFAYGPAWFCVFLVLAYPSLPGKVVVKQMFAVYPVPRYNRELT